MTALHGRAAIIRAIARGSSRFTSTWRDHLDILGQRQRAKLFAHLPGPAKKEKAHHSGALLGQAAARVRVVRGQQRLPPSAILQVPFHRREQARLEGVLR
jgi:hypothetical protein